MSVIKKLHTFQGIMIILTNNIEHLESNYAFQIFKIVANLLEIANATVNIFVYSVCNRDIRGTYRYFVLLVAQKVSLNGDALQGALYHIIPRFSYSARPTRTKMVAN